MQKLLAKFEPADCVALFVISGAFILLANHLDGTVSGALALIVGYYFGHKRQFDTETEIKGQN